MKRNKTTLFAAAVAAVVALGCGAGDDLADDPEARAAEAAGVGQPVRDGKFEFTVTAVECGLAKVGKKPIVRKPQGEFCRVSLTVKNIGGEAQYFAGEWQKALDAAGTQYSNDIEAEVIDADVQRPMDAEVNAGNQVKGALIYDVPAGTELTAIELHDSPFSGGVTVKLG